jgi:hypothetical protein
MYKFGRDLYIDWGLAPNAIGGLLISKTAESRSFPVSGLDWFLEWYYSDMLKPLRKVALVDSSSLDTSL